VGQFVSLPKWQSGRLPYNINDLVNHYAGNVLNSSIIYELEFYKTAQRLFKIMKRHSKGEKNGKASPPLAYLFTPINKYKTRFADIMIVNVFMEGLALASEIA
jgi:hypothetical protein